uniref:Uncharacterized protein n=1 Tax=Anguilla anguilla TaxID=7936 RepID=A0A0E9T1Q7_ANGAN
MNLLIIKCLWDTFLKVHFRGKPAPTQFL